MAAEVVHLGGGLLLQASRGFGDAAGYGLHGCDGSVGGGLEAFFGEVALECVFCSGCCGLDFVVGFGDG